MSDTTDILLNPATSSGLAAPDMSLLRKITPGDAKSFNLTHLAHYQKDNKHLFYIGAKHATDFETRTHEIISQSFAKHKPDILIIEGVETERGLSPSLGFDWKNPKHRELFINNSAENVHLAEVARAAKLPFIGGEPSHKDIFKALGDKGYSTKEVMALYFIRSVGAWKRTGSIKQKEQIPQIATSFFESDPRFTHVPKEERLNYQEFTAIYDAHKAELGNKELFDLQAADSNPHAGEKLNYFQTMSAVMDRVRDEHLINTVNDALAKHDKVMVVYGNAHQFVSAPVIEHMFGSKPQIETLKLTELQTPVAPEKPAEKPAEKATQPPSPTPHAPYALDSRHAPSTMSNWLKYGSFALLGAAVTALSFGTAPLVAGALLMGSAAAYTGSKLGEAATQPIAAPVYETTQAPQKAAQESTLATSQQPEKSASENKDVPKSWVAKSAAAEALQQTRSV
jgi:hypothetical protein